MNILLYFLARIFNWYYDLTMVLRDKDEKEITRLDRSI